MSSPYEFYVMLYKMLIKRFTKFYFNFISTLFGSAMYAQCAALSSAVR